MATRPPSHALTALLVVVLAAGCSQGFSRDEAVTAFAEATPDASRNEAMCVVDRLADIYEEPPIDESDLAALERELDTEPPSPEFERAQIVAMFRCGLTRPVEDALTEVLTASTLDAEQAACVAAELSATLSDDDLEGLLTSSAGPSDDGFYGRFFDASEACGALPNS